ncbi:MAG: tetratricopeptide repeat protein [Nitrospirae bacterium]|nr:MAG: tetratricopeptide repeat protein [Nitrospirota bacterium]
MAGGFLKRAIPMVSAIVLLFACATGGQESLKKAEAFYKLGIAKMQEGQYQQAFVQFQKAIMYNPEDKASHYALGLVYQQFGQYKEAETEFQKAIQIDKNYSEAYNSLGLLYTKMKRYKEAEVAFQKAIANPLYLNPERAITNLGMLYYRQDRYDDAEAQFKAALRRAPEFFPAYYGLALCYRAKGLYSEAAVALEQALNLDPAVQGDRQKAFDYFNKQKLLVDSQEEKADYEALIEILYY